MLERKGGKMRHRNRKRSKKMRKWEGRIKE